MINNFQQIKDLGLLRFDDDDDIYFIQIIQRKKEHPELGANSRIIKNYFILNEEHYDRMIPEIIQLCEVFNARAGFWVNRKSVRRTAIEAAQLILEQIKNDNPHYAYRAYSKAIGRNAKTRLWIIDIDTLDSERYNTQMPAFIDSLEPHTFSSKIIGKVYSKSGYHYITTPFNKQVFQKEFPDVDIQTNNFTNLYIP